MPIIDSAVYVDGHRIENPSSLDQTFEYMEAHGGMAWIGLLRPSSDELERVAAENPGQTLYVHANPAVVGWLEARRQSIMARADVRIRAAVKLRVNEQFPTDRYEIVAGHA